MNSSDNEPESTIRILGKTYTLHKLSESVGDSEFGQANYLTQVIQYNGRLGVDEMKDTVLHEVLHCIDHAIQTDLTEKQVHAIASGMFAIMKDNPGFIQWVISND